MPDNGKFRIYGEFIPGEDECVAKSLSGTAVNADDPYLIKGRMVHAVQDHQGETPDLLDFNWDYFDKQGFIKFEHDPLVVKSQKDGSVSQVTVPDPSNIIGAPLKRIAKSDKEMFLLGRLFPGLQKTEDTLKLQKAIEAHNRKYPTNKRNLGFSIEGRYIKKSKAPVRYSAEVFNVVITAQPQDNTTYMEMAENENATFAKSLMAGSETNPANMHGGDALRTQSLEGSSPNKKKEKTMKKFASMSECIDFHKSSGKSDEEAKEIAQKHFAEKKHQHEEEAEKGLRLVSEAVAKSIDAIGEVQKSLEKYSPEIVASDLDMKKSLVALKNNEVPDADQFIGTVVKSINALAGFVQESLVAVAKSNAEQANAIRELATMQKSLMDSEEDRADNLGVVAEHLVKLRKGIQLAKVSVTTDAKTLDSIEATSVAGKIVPAINVKAVEMELAKSGQREALANNDGLAKRYFQAQNIIASTGDLAKISDDLKQAAFKSLGYTE